MQRNASTTTPRYLVWVCLGCDECDPPDGSQRSAMPCDGPSRDGMEVVNANDYDRLREALDTIRKLTLDQPEGLFAEEAKILHDIAKGALDG